MQLASEYESHLAQQYGAPLIGVIVVLMRRYHLSSVVVTDGEWTDAEDYRLEMNATPDALSIKLIPNNQTEIDDLIEEGGAL